MKLEKTIMKGVVRQPHGNLRAGGKCTSTSPLNVHSIVFHQDIQFLLEVMVNSFARTW